MNPIPILLYHRVDSSGGPFATEPDVFARHLSWLAARGYRSVRTEELVSEVDRPGSTGRGNAVMITFDDGFADLATTVAPLLRDHGFTATAFVITARCPATPTAGSDHLSWSTARSLVDEGVLELQTHTHSHDRWPLDPEGAASMSDDLNTSLARLSDELGRPRRDFTHVAWPYGRTCREFEERAARLGLTSQYVVQRGAVSRAGRHHRLPRLLADGLSPVALGAWMTLLSTRSGARATNQIFGAIRETRHGSGYR